MEEQPITAICLTMNSFVLLLKQKHASWPGRCSRLGAVCVLSSIYTLTLAWWTFFYLDASGVLITQDLQGGKHAAGGARCGHAFDGLRVGVDRQGLGTCYSLDALSPEHT